MSTFGNNDSAAIYDCVNPQSGIDMYLKILCFALSPLFLLFSIPEIQTFNRGGGNQLLVIYWLWQYNIQFINADHFLRHEYGTKSLKDCHILAIFKEPSRLLAIEVFLRFCFAFVVIVLIIIRRNSSNLRKSKQKTKQKTSRGDCTCAQIRNLKTKVALFQLMAALK